MSNIPSPPDFTVLHQAPAHCAHALMPQDDPHYLTIYPYRCGKCPARFSACEVDVVEGNMQLHDFTVKRRKRSTRRSGF